MKVILFRVLFGYLLVAYLILSILTTVAGISKFRGSSSYRPSATDVIIFGGIELLCCMISASFFCHIKSKSFFYFLLFFPLIGSVAALVHLIWSVITLHSILNWGLDYVYPLLSFLIQMGIIIMAVILRVAMINEARVY